MIRIIHVSDIHFWEYPANPLKLLNKRIVGVTELALGRARRFRLERVESLVGRVVGLDPDHILISGDLTTTALDGEFRAARLALDECLRPGRVTVIPGNHDRYTGESLRARRFERYFGEFAPAEAFPWLREIDEETAILALDPTRPGISARGKLPEDQIRKGRQLLSEPNHRPRRLLIACHYPLEAPAAYRKELHEKRLVNAPAVRAWLANVGPHIFCCGHVHAAWAFIPEDLPNQLCLNAGAPLLHDKRHASLPGFLEILLDDNVTVKHHAWDGGTWIVNELWVAPGFFP